MNHTYNVIGIGEVLWDMLPEGKQFGGAPANFAYHVSQLGATSAVVSAIGKDDLGLEIVAVLEKMGIANHLSETPAPTGTVGITLQDGIPSYTIYENVAWDEIRLTGPARQALIHTDALCFGTLAQRSPVSKAAILEALELVPENCLKIYDINLRQNYFSKETIGKSMRTANVVKLNEEELETIAGLFDLEGSEEDLARLLIQTYELDVLALTKGIDGSLLLSPDNISRKPTPGVEVADTVGAGDSFTAVLAVGLLCGIPLQEIHDLAVKVSAFVCTQHGATPEFPLTMINEMDRVLCK